MRRNLGALFLGLLAGALLIHLSHAHRLDQLYFDREKLKVQLFETTERLTRCEELRADQHREGINSVEFEIRGEIEPFVELELQRLAREITAGLAGAAIGDVQPELLVALLHRRKFTVEKKDYLIAVNWVVIAPETRFNLGVSPAP